MPAIKILLTTITLLLLTNVGFSQTAKMEQEAEAKVTELNNLLVSVNPDLALNQTQLVAIKKLQVKKAMDIEALKKMELIDDVEKTQQTKDIRKAMWKSIHQEVLTKEQRQAKKQANNASDN